MLSTSVCATESFTSELDVTEAVQSAAAAGTEAEADLESDATEYPLRPHGTHVM